MKYLHRLALAFYATIAAGLILWLAFTVFVTLRRLIEGGCI